MGRAVSIGSGLGAVTLVACGGVISGSALLGPSEQACVENAIRRGADEATARDAVGRFTTACREGDGAACSALGVAYALGGGVERDERRALELFEGACSSGNERGCVNLGRELMEGRGGAPDAARAERLFSAACEAGEASGCAQLGRWMIRSGEIKTHPTFVRDVLEKACAGRENEACLDLGDVFTQMQRSSEALAAYAQACIAGEEQACRRMDGGVTRESDTAAAAWRSR